MRASEVVSRTNLDNQPVPQKETLVNVPTSDTCNLNQLPAAKSFRRKRFSSYDRSGGNKDMLIVEPGGACKAWNRKTPSSLLIFQ